MSEVLNVQVESLLARVRETARRACWELESDAEVQVRTMLADARRQARATVRAAAREKRERVAERCRRARAGAETQDRAAAFAREAGVLRGVRTALPSALERRWQDDAARRAWCRAAVALAARTLVSKDARASLAGGATPEEREALVRDAARAGLALSWAGDAVDRAGLRIASGGTVIDASLAGLLADADGLDARALALLAARRAPEAAR